MKPGYLFLNLCILMCFLLIISSSTFAQVAEPGNGNKLISMSFQDAELDSVLDFFSKATGYTIVKDAELKARVSIISQKDIPVEQALSVLDSILTVKGYAAVVNEKIIKIVPLESAKQENSEIRVGIDPLKIEPGDTIVTQIMPLSYTSATQVVKDMKEFIPKYGIMIAHARNNTLIVTATSSNVRRLAQIIKELDVPMSDLIKAEVIIIKYRDATTLATVIEKLFEKPKETTAAEQAQIDRSRRFRGGPPFQDFGQQGGDAAGAETTTAAGSERLQLMGDVKVVADKDTNSIIASASQENLNIIKEMINQLDKETTGQAETRVFTLEYADAADLAVKLNSAFQSTTSRTSRQTSSIFGRGGFGQGGFGPGGGGPGQQQGTGQTTTGAGVLGLPEVNVTGDERTNSLIVTTTTLQMESISRLIKELDTDVADFEQDTFVFSLENAEASNIASVLNSLFQTTAFEQRRARTTTSGGGGFFGTAADTVEMARGLSGNVKIVAEQTTNSLVITTYKRNFISLEKIIKQLDIMLPQFLIEAKIVEVTLNDESKFGIEWMWEQDSKVKGNNYTQTGKTSFKLAEEVYGLKYSILGQSLEGLLMALEKNTNVNILATPRILTLDNREAIINIGQEVPYLQSTQQTSSGNVITTYDFRDVGVILTVTPRINKSETVTMDVNQEINSLIEFTLFNAPVVAKREASSSVTVKDGQTMIIGGIIQDNKKSTTNKIPILGSIPFIGKLFQRQETTTEKTELMVFITPHIVRSIEEAEQLSLKQQSELSHPSAIKGKIENSSN
jgi:general secretion pathway protein D